MLIPILIEMLTSYIIDDKKFIAGLLLEMAEFDNPRISDELYKSYARQPKIAICDGIEVYKQLLANPKVNTKRN